MKATTSSVRRYEKLTPSQEPGISRNTVRRYLRAEAVATRRYETGAGEPLQCDFGQTTVEIAGENARVYLCLVTLGYSRRPYVEAYENEKVAAWLQTIKGAFRYFGGITTKVLVDNARAPVSKHDVATLEVVFSSTFAAFARYWGFKPRAYAPYRARTKGKDERGVGYVKRNAIAGRQFKSMEPSEPTSSGACERWPTCASTRRPDSGQ